MKIMTKEVSILSTDGKQVGQISLDEKVFGVEPNIHVMHMAVRRQLNNGRQGSACAKTRAEVSGGGKKPWKQKVEYRVPHGWDCHSTHVELPFHLCGTTIPHGWNTKCIRLKNHSR